MNLKTLKFIHEILAEKISDWDFKGDVERHKQAIMACIELKNLIEFTEKRSIGLRQLAYKQKIRMPVRMPFDIEVDVL